MKNSLLLFIFLSILISSAWAQPGRKAADYYRAGKEFKNSNRYYEALAAFKYALSLNKNMDSAHLELGEIYVRYSNYDSAIYHYNKALKINPVNTSGLFSLAGVYRNFKPRYDSAILCYRTILRYDSLKAVVNDSLHKVCYYNIAWCYNAKKEYDSAFKTAAKALEIDNNFRAPYGEMGHAIRRMQKWEEGIAQFRKNLAISVVDLPMYYIGMIYTEIKDKESALKEYEELRKINPKMAESLKKTIDKMQ
ncbi:MAG: tetratricopeptide repeat protein [Chitinophagaceae bacterium]|nr:tetratricopeptide repeat protein [Chitinophagaceae bacterium]